MTGDNLNDAGNQQERLDAYLAGFVDGEGCFHVAIQRNPSTRLGIQVVPEFQVSQNFERRMVLTLLRERLQCGRIQDNHRGSSDTSLVFVVRRREDLLKRVIPFFEAQPLLSPKQAEFVAFARIVRSMSIGAHLHEEGLDALVKIALAMNGGGRYRRARPEEWWIKNPQRPYAEHLED